MHLWDRAFFIGSVLAAFSQGLMLGMFVEGFTVTGREFTGSSFDWLGWFPLISGVALIFGYGLLGAAWLVLKTEGALQVWARRVGKRMLLLVLAFIAIVTLYMLRHNSEVIGKWFATPRVFFLWPVPLGTALAAAWAWRSFDHGDDLQPFISTVVMFFVSFLGLAISMWPNIVPPSIDLWSAAASRASQQFLLVGTAFLLPMILSYTAWSYWVFRGKVRADHGYGH